MDFPYYVILGFFLCIGIVLVYFWIYPPCIQSNTCAVVTLNPINSVVTGTTITVSGMLTDHNGNPLSDKKISFIPSLPGMNIPETTTGGITFASPDGSEIQVESCPMNYNGTNDIPDCAPDFEGLQDADGNKIMRLKVESTINFPPSTKGVTLFIMNMNNSRFGVEVTTYSEPVTTFTAGSAGTIDGTADFHLVDKDGIRQVKIMSINGSSVTSSTVGVAAVATFDPAGDPVQQHKIDFENLNAGSVQSPFTVDGGMFFTTTKAPQVIIVPYYVKANFNGDGTNGAAGQWGFFNTIASSRDNGIGSYYSAIPDLGTGIAITLNDCAGAQDIDDDSICDTWEMTRAQGGLGGVKFTDSNGVSSIYDLSYIDDNGNAVNIGSSSGISKNHKDLFVEIDYLERHNPTDWKETSNPPNGTKDPGEKSAIDLVKSAFASVPNDSTAMRKLNPDGKNGIKLHVIVDRQLDQLDTSNHHIYNPLDPSVGTPNVDSINVWTDPSNAPDNLPNDFDDIKLYEFGTTADRNNHGGNYIGNRLLDSPQPGWLLAKAQVYHYFLFVNNIGAPGTSTCGPSGNAEVKGNDGLVALGCGWDDVFTSEEFTDHVTPATDTYKEGAINKQAGTFMHELGHNLGLEHGGPRETWDPSTSTWVSVPTIDSSMNCKPNYISVMSYSRQFPTYMSTADWGSPHLSVGAASSLDESHLREDDGVWYPIPTKVVFQSPPGYTRAGATYVSPATSINWTADHDDPPNENDVAVDLNNFGIRSCGKDDLGLPKTSMEVMTSYQDWYNARFNFRSGFTSIDGIHPDPDKIGEITSAIYEDMIEHTDVWYDDEGAHFNQSFWQEWNATHFPPVNGITYLTYPQYFASPYYHPTSGSGPLAFDKAMYNSSGFPVITVTDASANTDSGDAETVQVRVYSTSDAVGLNITLTETGADTGVFVGNVTLGMAAGQLQVNVGDTITAKYTFAGPPPADIVTTAQIGP